MSNPIQDSEPDVSESQSEESVFEDLINRCPHKLPSLFSKFLRNKQDIRVFDFLDRLVDALEDPQDESRWEKIVFSTVELFPMILDLACDPQTWEAPSDGHPVCGVSTLTVLYSVLLNIREIPLL